MRKVWIYLLLTAGTIGLGLASRTSIGLSFCGPWLGDFLYALMVFWFYSFLFPNQKLLRRLFAALLFCYFIEAFQLYKAPWILEIRSNRLGALIFGSGFSWADIFAYTFAVILGSLADGLWLSKSLKRLGGHKT